MAGTNAKKIKLLVLYDLLCKYTDENHTLNTDEIIAMLADAVKASKLSAMQSSLEKV